MPVNNVEFVNAAWETHPLFPSGPAGLALVGSTFSAFLLLDRGEKVENTSFVLGALTVKDPKALPRRPGVNAENP